VAGSERGRQARILRIWTTLHGLMTTPIPQLLWKVSPTKLYM